MDWREKSLLRTNEQRKRRDASNVFPTPTVSIYSFNPQIPYLVAQVKAKAILFVIARIDSASALFRRNETTNLDGESRKRPSNITDDTRA
ncbi:hypothetical protein X797_003778 [Metarhizium robertsii]|uniref:Uncharacterized protein n=1 Tax=Metarhizium robertsii TaxID=568076 RepID=A0A0A1UZ67_9HYPO|nr:hypothetical protein X797_003778 [Metarhizium robertsii]